MAKRVPGKEEFDETLRYFGRRSSCCRRRAAARRTRVDAAALLARPASTRWCWPPASRRAIPRIAGQRPRQGARATSTCCATASRSAQRVAIIGAGGIGFDVAEFLDRTDGDERQPCTRRASTREWGIDAGTARRRPARGQRVEPPAREVTCCSARRSKVGAGLGKTTGWIHRAGSGDARRRDAGRRQLRAHRRRTACMSRSASAARSCSRSTPSCCAPARSRCASWPTPLRPPGVTVHLIGGADVAAELDAKRAIDQGTRLAARL